MAGYSWYCGICKQFLHALFHKALKLVVTQDGVMTSSWAIGDLQLLGLGAADRPSKDDIKRAFRRCALQCHPDKNRHDPVGAAESFRRLAAAYQRLTSAQHSTAQQAWEDLDVCEDVLTEEFFAEAFAQDIPPFELMYIQERMAAAKRGRTAADAETPAAAAAAGGVSAEGSNGEAAEPRVCVWAEDPAAESHDASSDAMWRRIHKIISKRKRREERARARAAELQGGGAGQGGADGRPGTSTSSSHQQHHRSHRRRHFSGSREDKRMLFWDFLTDLVRQDERSYCYVPVDDGEGGPGAAHEGVEPSQGTQLQLTSHKVYEGCEANEHAVDTYHGNDNGGDEGVQGWGSAAFYYCGRVDSLGIDGHMAGDFGEKESMKEGDKVGLAHGKRGRLHQPLLLQKGCEDFIPVECSGVQQQQQQQQPQHALGSARMRRRTNWRFYWTWAKRLLLIRALLYMLPS
ncbi:hypothetical protein DUNSADRAFT_18013 [Dunaliella salina]|uniref:J domain-containing protein n=1 Tax=Dunaliella salina TaxID=3046 RepID=A0ABQ7G0T5_DUNSA|nr:hypothetical protein DUNSADRAFT_18013 [Dunaliella salina]|eukprot:KAF5828220.1 hypothetical protein DUNSADRAFT_18013 [Dunaliella salina]